MTAPFRPLAGYLLEMARQAALGVPGVKQATVELLDEPWTPPHLALDEYDWDSGPHTV